MRTGIFALGAVIALACTGSKASAQYPLHYGAYGGPVVVKKVIYPTPVYRTYSPLNYGYVRPGFQPYGSFRSAYRAPYGGNFYRGGFGSPIYRRSGVSFGFSVFR